MRTIEEVALSSSMARRTSSNVTRTIEEIALPSSMAAPTSSIGGRRGSRYSSSIRIVPVGQ